MSDTKDKDLIKTALKQFQAAAEAEKDNRERGEADLRFARLADQWPQEVRDSRELQGRPCLTINKLPAFIRQIVNDARQNKPSITCRPVDSGADLETAELLNGVIRHIEANSNADIAYDTAVDCSVSTGFGYFRISIDYAADDVFDLDIRIEAIPNQFSVFGDPNSTCADSSDWNVAFVLKKIPKDDFEAKYGKRTTGEWEDYDALDSTWYSDGQVTIAEYWTRETAEREIAQLADGRVIDVDDVEDQAQVVDTRTTQSHRVTQRIITGAEVLETTDWKGKYIPIIPVYGEEINEKGKRHFRSLIHDSIDPQRMFNYWRTASTELVALAPRSPWIGPTGAFETDGDRWATANTVNHPYLQYDGDVSPQRQPFAGIPAGALQESLNANDDMKSIMGIYDASLGARSNETSGKAIMARQRESDVGSFHFIDNLVRAIRHAGRVILDLIPYVYTPGRIARILGLDGASDSVPLGQPYQGPDGKIRIYDLTVGKYDLTVHAGPSYTSKRQEAAEQMTEFVRVFPQSAPLIGDLLAKNLDWPGADEIAQRLQTMLPPQLQQQQADGSQGGGQQQDPRMQQAMQQMQQQLQQAMAELKKMQAENQQLKSEGALKAEELKIKGFDAETKRLQATQAGMTPEQVQALVVQTIQQLFDQTINEMTLEISGA